MLTASIAIVGLNALALAFFVAIVFVAIGVVALPYWRNDKDYYYYYNYYYYDYCLFSHPSGGLLVVLELGLLRV